MLQKIKCLLGSHRHALALSDRNGEFELGDKTYSGEIDLYACVDCGKVIAKTKWNNKIAIGDPGYIEEDIWS